MDVTGNDHIKWIKSHTERQRAHFLPFVGHRFHTDIQSHLKVGKCLENNKSGQKGVRNGGGGYWLQGRVIFIAYYT